MTDLRCHFDADGWLCGPVGITHVLTPNRYNSGFAVHGKGVVMHTEAGYEAGTVATFMNPAAQVSAFFSIAAAGACHQYLPVGQGYVAWSQSAGNSSWRGIEDEDGTHPSVPLTAAQVTTFAQILEACSAYDGFPLQITDSVDGTGLITHGDGGEAWGGHFGCPGDVRKAQRPAIIALARQIRAGGTVTLKAYETTGRESWAEVAAVHKIGSAHLLRLNGGPDEPFPAEIAAYINGGNLKAPMLAKITVKVPA